MADERPSNLWANMAEAHFERGLTRRKRPRQREIDLEILLVAVIRAAGGQVEFSREELFEADESDLEPTHRFDRDRRKHVLGLRPITPPPDNGHPEDADADADADGQPALTG